MSHAIALPAVLRRRSTAFGAVRALLLSLLMLFAHGASADPVLARQQLDDAKHSLTELSGHYYRGKFLIPFGELDAAQASFGEAHEWATRMQASLVRLRYENRHTLDNGLYRNGAAQQQALNHTEVAINLVRQLQMKLLSLRLDPRSELDVILANQSLVSLRDRMTLLEQAMVAAQQ